MAQRLCKEVLPLLWLWMALHCRQYVWALRLLAPSLAAALTKAIFVHHHYSEVVIEVVEAVICNFVPVLIVYNDSHVLPLVQQVYG